MNDGLSFFILKITEIYIFTMSPKYSFCHSLSLNNLQTSDKYSKIAGDYEN